MTKIRRIKLLKVYRQAGLSIASAYIRLGAYKQKHFGVE